jgi:hypothetical protein
LFTYTMWVWVILFRHLQPGVEPDSKFIGWVDWNFKSTNTMILFKMEVILNALMNLWIMIFITSLIELIMSLYDLLIDFIG